MNSRTKAPKVMSRLIKVAVIAAIIAVVVDSLPDIKRYKEIRQM